MKVKYTDLPNQFNDDKLWNEIKKVFKKCNFILGSEVKEFESKFAAYCNTKYAIGLNSGTDAIFLALKIFNVGKGDEVITAPNSFVATAGAIVAAGAKPVFVDVGPDYNIDVSRIEKAINKKTKAIIPVHLTGNMADMAEILVIAKRYNLYVIEDAAQAAGASLNNKFAGSFGDVGCFSLHPLKNLNICGDGGLLTTNSKDVYQKVSALRNHGFKNRDRIINFGYNSRLDTLQALVAMYGLKNLNKIIKKRNKNANLYEKELKNIDGVIVPPRGKGKIRVFHTYIIQVNKREKLIKYLADHGVQTKVHYPIPIHLQPPCKSMGYKKGDFPVCEEQAKRILTLPIHQYLTETQISYITKLIKDFYTKH